MAVINSALSGSSVQISRPTASVAFFRSFTILVPARKRSSSPNPLNFKLQELGPNGSLSIIGDNFMAGRPSELEWLI